MTTKPGAPAAAAETACQGRHRFDCTFDRYLAPGTPRRWAWVGVIGLVLCALLFARKPHALLTPQLWAEDGVIFYLEQDIHGWPGAWLTPYAGYLHFIPRLVATIAAPFGPGPTPAIYNTTAFALWCGVVLSLLSPRVLLPGRVWLALVVVLVPHTGEVLFQLVNVQWITALLLIRQLLVRPAESTGEKLFDVLALGCAAFTGPFSLLLWPLFAWRAWIHREIRSARVEFAVITLGACAHAVAGSLDPHVQAPSLGFDPALGTAFLGRRLPGVLFLGWDRAMTLTIGPQLLLGLLLAFLIAGLLWSSRRMGTSRLLIMLTAAGAVLVGSALVKGGPSLWNETDLGVSDRYLFLPRILLGWLLISAAIRPTPAGMLVATLLVWSAWINRDLYSVPTPTDYRWRENASRLLGPYPARVPILPDGWNIDHPGKKGSRPEIP